MLKNCFLPVNYLKSNTKTCGEIICENQKQFIINCNFCKIKIFEFDEFVQHFQKIHLEETKNDTKPSQSFVDSLGPEEEDDDFKRIVILDAEELVEPKKEQEKQIKNENIEDDFICEPDLNYSSDDDKDYKPYTDDEQEEVEEDECEDNMEQSKSIIKKTPTDKNEQPVCKLCGRTYANSGRLTVHMKLQHMREKKFKCNVCSEAFIEERSLTSHINNKHTDHECPDCHKIFTSNRNMKRHRLIHTSKREFVCLQEGCNKRFVSKAQMTNHYQRSHKNDILICEECGYKCRERESLKVHKRHHTGEKPFECEICKSRFGCKKNLTEHMSVHDTERRHECTFCGKSYKSKKALYHHKYIHLDFKKFVCKICGNSYAQASGLSGHMRKHKLNIIGCNNSAGKGENIKVSNNL